MARFSQPVVVAFTSVLAAIGLTAFKLVVGLTTGSLGILSEFAHSGLDLVAALVTFFAVRAAARPPDAEHPFGHGKVENLAALVETLLLLVACAWIVHEGVIRLTGKPVPVRATVWSFVVMVVSIIVDLSRSRALARAAKKYRSQALEADALHFSTDVWSSSVVLLGLVAVRLGELTSSPQLFWRADAVAALGVAAVATWVGIRLGRRTIDALVDRAPPGAQERVTAAVRSVSGVEACKRVRIRTGGGTTFVDAVVTVEAEALELAHGVAHDVQRRVQAEVPGADVMVHTAPRRPVDVRVPAAIRRVAYNRSLGIHAVAAHSVGGALHVTLHLEVDASLPLREAWKIAEDFEAALRQEVPKLERVDIHLEPRPTEVAPAVRVSGADTSLMEAIPRLATDVDLVRGCHDLHLETVDGVTAVAFHLTFDPDLPLAQVHDACDQVESRLRSELDGLGRIAIQAEPVSW